MAERDLVVATFNDLADALTALAERVRDDLEAERAADACAVRVGAAAEQFAGAFPDGNVPAADNALELARSATAAVRAITGRPLDQAALGRAIDACNTACAALPASAAGPLRSTARPGLIGALRVTPASAPDRPAALARGNLAIAAANAKSGAEDKADPPDKSYIARLVLLFPTEAVTLFPIGRSIAGDDPGLLLLVILIVAFFVTGLRFLGTMDPQTRQPAWAEIWIALFSYLLWVGAIDGYNVGGRGWFAFWPTQAKAQGLYGFLIIVWVTLVPYFRVVVPAKHPTTT